MLVVCDTSPLNYLVQMDLVSLLPLSVDRAVVPAAVHRELLHERTPEIVRRWIASAPQWIEIRDVEVAPSYLPHLHPGERSAIALAQQLQTLLVVDDRDAREAAEKLDIRVVGTLGLVDRWATHGWISRKEARDRIKSTNFRVSSVLLEELFPAD